MRSMRMPKRSHQTESLLRPKREWPLAKGTPLSMRIAAGRELLLEVQRSLPNTSESEVAQAFLYRLKEGGTKPAAVEDWPLIDVSMPPAPPPKPSIKVDEAALRPVITLSLIAWPSGLPR
jgi:hypothetical protein